jgi:ParB-like chromosome segregation protein Spo0J
MSAKHDLQVVETMVDEISQHPDNANNGDLDALVQSIETNGFFAPVIVQATTGYIIAGNHRWQAANRLGMVTIPAIFLDVDDMQAKRMMLADNRITRLGHDDPALLTDLLAELSETDLGLLGTGFSQRDLQTLQDFADKPLEFPEEPENDDPGGYGLGGMYHVEPEVGDFDGEVLSIRVTRRLEPRP